MTTFNSYTPLLLNETVRLYMEFLSRTRIERPDVEEIAEDV